MSPEPDLTAELDDAEAIVTGRAEDVVTEWGVRLPAGRVLKFGADGKGTALSWMHARERLGDHPALVRRTVTYGPWREADDSAPVTPVREDEDHGR